VKDDPATGWVNGPDEFRSCQSGYRPLNGARARHAPLDGSKALLSGDTNTSPTGSLQCYPMHGPNPDIDQIIGLANIDLKARCSGNKEQWEQVGANGGPKAPASNNYYDATRVRAQNAPADCSKLYTDAIKDSQGLLALCTTPLQAIVDACPWNSGQVDNVSGTWTLQSCPLGEICAVGDLGKHIH
jgi:hypothetical protein